MALVIVDDEPDITGLVREIAARQGLSADVAHGVREFLGLDIMTYDLVVLDLKLPDGDGIELLHHLASSGSTASLIIISGCEPSVLEATRELAISQGFPVVAALEKPFDTTELAAAFEAVPESAALPSTATGKTMPGDDEVRHAITAAGDEIITYFQPKVWLMDGTLAGVEALVRWRHPERGLLEAGALVPAAERLGLIDDLTWIVLDQALGQCRAWKDQGHNIQVGVNMSASTLHRLDIPERVATMLAALDIGPEQLLLELTESALTREALHSMEVLLRLRLMGLALSIDDFGTGYSTMQQLQRVPFSELKVDRSFVQGLAKSPQCRIITESNIDLAHKLDLNAIAEGVEDEAAWDLLTGLGCDLAQGYFIAKPMPGEDLIRWYETWRAARPIPPGTPIAAGWVAAAVPDWESERLADLRNLNVLDTLPDEKLDHITALVADVFEVQTALVSLVDADRQWFKSARGTDLVQTSRSQSFCAHAILEDDVMVVRDAAHDARFSANPLVSGETRIRFYAGAILRGPKGHPIGTLCLIHPEPRDFPQPLQKRLEAFAALVEQELNRPPQERSVQRRSAITGS